MTNLQPRPLRLLADAGIPLAREAFAAWGEVEAVPAGEITPARLRTVDVLLVRSVTRVDAALLAGSPVRFVGTATIGTDHVDAAWLASQGIAFASAPGSNAESVVEWVLAALLSEAARRGEGLAGRTAAVVGVGNVGGRLAPRLEALGLRVRCVDPPRGRAEGAAGFVSLEAALAEADLVTLHVPLVRDGMDRTEGLFDAARFALLRPGAWLVNAARGRVVVGDALRDALARGQVGAALLDVFEGEPAPDPALVAACALATPHIAGHSYDGKVGGTLLLREALAAWQAPARPDAFDAAERLALAAGDVRTLPLGAAPHTGEDATAWLAGLVQALYPIREDDARLRACLREEALGACFTALRSRYPRRRRWGLYGLDPAHVPAQLHRAVFDGLGLHRTA